MDEKIQIFQTSLDIARLLAEQMVDEKGEFHPCAPKLLYHPLGYSDGAIAEHQANFLKRWNSDREFVKKFRKFSLPLCHRRAEEIVRASLLLPPSTPLKDFHVRRAAVTTFLTPLRQSIGSCFATAPAIMSQKHHFDLFLEDLYELLTAGRLRRVVEGAQYSVPFNPSFGVEDPKFTHALLKAWEFTLASFCDVKMEFSRWNISWALGLDPQEQGGIGQALYSALSAKLDEANRTIDEFQKEVALTHRQLKVAETLYNVVSSPEQLHRHKSEIQALAYHLRSCEDLRDESQKKAKIYSQFFSFLMEQYTARFQEYFQEIYDPEMSEIVSTGPYEDRRAGFRLVYKHGRSDSSLWTRIVDSQGLVSSLIDFFSQTENIIAYGLSISEEKEVLEEMTTVAIHHVQSDLFIETALSRAAAKGRTPWAYLSGGTMDQLLPIYFRSRSLQKEGREIHDELDLFTFLLESLKGFGTLDPSRGLLIESPTHAFSILPDFPLFQEGWTDAGFTYTWIRDRFLLPGQKFYSEMALSREDQKELMRRLSLHADTAPSMSLEVFASQFPQIPRDALASFLFRTVPLVSPDRCQAVLHEMGVNLQALPSYLSSEELQRLVASSFQDDPTCHEKAAEQARRLGLASPICLFADTNWPQAYFGFVIHPLSLQLEVWKADKSGTTAAPLPLVKSWLGKGRDFTWTLYQKY